MGIPTGENFIPIPMGWESPLPRQPWLSVNQNAEQYDILMDLIRKMVATSDTDKKIQFLTLSPQTCSRNTFTNFFAFQTTLFVKPAKLQDYCYPWRDCTQKRQII